MLEVFDNFLSFDPPLLLVERFPDAIDKIIDEITSDLKPEADALILEAVTRCVQRFSNEVADVENWSTTVDRLGHGIKVTVVTNERLSKLQEDLSRILLRCNAAMLRKLRARARQMVERADLIEIRADQRDDVIKRQQVVERATEGVFEIIGVRTSEAKAAYAATQHTLRKNARLHAAGSMDAMGRDAGVKVMRYAAPVRVSGATGPHSVSINGVYRQVEGEASGGRPVYKKDGADSWIEYWTESDCWQVKPGNARGENTSQCWMQTSAKDAVVVEEVTGEWKVAQQGVFKEQAGVKVMRYAGFLTFLAALMAHEFAFVKRKLSLTNSILADVVARSWPSASNKTFAAALTKIFHDLDVNRDGALSLEEFTPLAINFARMCPTEEGRILLTPINFFNAIKSGIDPSLWGPEPPEPTVEMGSNGGMSKSDFLGVFRQLLKHHIPDFDFELGVMSDEDQRTTKALAGEESRL